MLVEAEAGAEARAGAEAEAEGEAEAEAEAEAVAESEAGEKHKWDGQNRASLRARWAKGHQNRKCARKH